MKTVAHGALLGLAAALLPSVAAHGYVSSITVDGEEHKGPNVADGESSECASLILLSSYQSTSSISSYCTLYSPLPLSN